MPSPNPTWKPGDSIDSPVGEMLQIDPASIPYHETYKLMTGSVVPRPIAFVSTCNSKGQGNLAPFSFFNAISSNPPCLMISCSRRTDGSKKDSLINIEETGQFVVNSSHEWLAEALVHCAAEFSYGVDEMSKVGLTPLPSVKVKASRVKESAVQFECELFKLIEIGDGTAGSSTMVIGKIVLVHVAKEVYSAGRILVEKFKPLARLAGISYATLGEPFDISVPKIK